jgi:hypothetical protein
VRILPRVLGGARRAQASAEHAATVSLSAVTDNPVYLPPGDARPLGAAYSNGGYHNGHAVSAIDAIAVAQADLCQLAQRLTDHLFQNPATAGLVGYDEWSVKPLHMVQNGWVEEARAIASRLRTFARWSTTSARRFRRSMSRVRSATTARSSATPSRGAYLTSGRQRGDGRGTQPNAPAAGSRDIASTAMDGTYIPADACRVECGDAVHGG